MLTFGWTLHVPKDQQNDILPQLRAIVCDKLNFCASVGCSCATGADEPPLCFEDEAGSQHHLHTSEGPTWAVFIRALDKQIIIDVHPTEMLSGMEMHDLYCALLAFNYPTFEHSIHQGPD